MIEFYSKHGYRYIVKRDSIIGFRSKESVGCYEIILQFSRVEVTKVVFDLARLQYKNFEIK